MWEPIETRSIATNNVFIVYYTTNNKATMSFNLMSTLIYLGKTHNSEAYSEHTILAIMFWNFKTFQYRSD